MNLKVKIAALTIAMIFTSVACTSKAQIEKALEDNPEIVFNAIKKRPGLFFKTINDIRPMAEQEMKAEEEKSEDARIEDEFKNPKAPLIEDKRVFFGNK